MTTVTKKYPDTTSGAIQALSDMSSLDTSGAVALSDTVQGVYKVLTPNDYDVSFAIVYLAGYRDPWGRVRACNDFECEERQ